jgi:general secretion pathway protein E
LLDVRWSQPFSTRIKVLSGLETHVRQRPQDGRLTMQLEGVTVEARVSSLPTEVGERLVLRIVRGTRGVPDLASLGLSAQTHAGLVEVLARPQGLIFVTGPVGSGKTTTLYSALKHVVDTRGRLTSVVTLEDPIELELPFATQTQMHSRAGRNFAGTLRSVLRQDPNVLMIGEIRDRETAEIATQAGLTGHLILTTLHADGAAGPFSRLAEMQIEPFLVASATVGCLSQRLVRTLCAVCAREAEPTRRCASASLRSGPRCRRLATACRSAVTSVPARASRGALRSASCSSCVPSCARR